MCQCQNQSCGCAKGGCGCSHSAGGSCSCGCASQKMGSCGTQSKNESCASKFLELADQAWMEVLKEKIKEQIKSSSKNMDELARMIAEANHERWKKKMDAKNCCGCFEEKLKKFFEQSCSTK